MTDPYKVDRWICATCGHDSSLEPHWKVLADHYQARVKELEAEVAEQRRAVATLGRLLDCRAGKLLLQGTPFMVVKCSTDYAKQVARLIKAEQVTKGDWSDDDQAWMNASLGTGWDIATLDAKEGTQP